MLWWDNHRLKLLCPSVSGVVMAAVPMWLPFLHGNQVKEKQVLSRCLIYTTWPQAVNTCLSLSKTTNTNMELLPTLLPETPPLFWDSFLTDTGFERLMQDLPPFDHKSMGIHQVRNWCSDNRLVLQVTFKFPLKVFGGAEWRDLYQPVYVFHIGFHRGKGGSIQPMLVGFDIVQCGKETYASFIKRRSRRKKASHQRDRNEVKASETYTHRLRLV